MYEYLIYHVKDFLTSHLKGERPLLLGCSGGPDSLALLHLLLECCVFSPFTLHVAHIDHRWREESAEEASILQKHVEQFHLPFHLHTLHNFNSGSNLENRCRTERLKFFSKLHHTHRFQALILGHHADDQAEVILKRICEGASLRALGGLKSVYSFLDIPIWRPLLPFRKNELESFLANRHLIPFDDRSNRDKRFLRGRIRTEIFPHLERSFGKMIGKNFVRLGTLFHNLQDYFQEKAKNIEKHLIIKPFGFQLPLHVSFHPLELEYFIRSLAERENAHLSYRACQDLLRLIETKNHNRRIIAPPLTFLIKQDHLLISRIKIQDTHNQKVKKK
jgi:tRNA(Ile)-lysidine synthase